MGLFDGGRVIDEMLLKGRLVDGLSAVVGSR